MAKPLGKVESLLKYARASHIASDLRTKALSSIAAITDPAHLQKIAPHLLALAADPVVGEKALGVLLDLRIKAGPNVSLGIDEEIARLTLGLEAAQQQLGKLTAALGELGIDPTSADPVASIRATLKAEPGAALKTRLNDLLLKEASVDGLRVTRDQLEGENTGLRANVSRITLELHNLQDIMAGIMGALGMDLVIDVKPEHAANILRVIDKLNDKASEVDSLNRIIREKIDEIERVQVELRTAKEENEKTINAKDRKINDIDERLRTVLQNYVEVNAQLSATRQTTPKDLAEVAALREKVARLEIEAEQKAWEVKHLNESLETARQSHEAIERTSAIRISLLGGELNRANADKAEAERKLAESEVTVRELRAKVAGLEEENRSLLVQLPETHAETIGSASEQRPKPFEIGRPFILLGNEPPLLKGPDFAVVTNKAGRNHNEDSSGYLRLNAEQEIFVVSDGMGGHQGGETASKMTVEIYLQSRKSGRSMVDSAKRACKAVYERSTTDPLLKDMGATLTVYEVDSKRKTVGIMNIGDSRVKVVDGPHEGRVLTKDHHMKWMMFDMDPANVGKISLIDGMPDTVVDEIERGASQNAITSRIGGKATPDYVDLIVIPFEESDREITLLAYSDGLVYIKFNDDGTVKVGMKETDVTEVVNAYISVSDVVVNLLAKAKTAKGPKDTDNITVAALRRNIRLLNDAKVVKSFVLDNATGQLVEQVSAPLTPWQVSAVLTRTFAANIKFDINFFGVNSGVLDAGTVQRLMEAVKSAANANSIMKLYLARSVNPAILAANPKLIEQLGRQIKLDRSKANQFIYIFAETDAAGKVIRLFADFNKLDPSREHLFKS
ncbi:protein phosphatase 2C domain-containing protein [Candidatus Saganbacteria bacterium]|nr:protein phosphatase 2C domain-containing protein [Candidatus Saganbacteria bacterium]